MSSVAFITQLGFGIVAPVLPAYAASFGAGTVAVGLVVASYGLARLVTNYPAGLLAERVGRRILLITGGITLGIGSALCAMAPSFPWLVVFRFVAGVGAAMVLTMAQVILADISSLGNRGRIMSMYQGFFLLGVGLGPVPGGILADKYGLAAPFFGFALLAVTGAFVAALFVPETRARQKDAAGARDRHTYTMSPAWAVLKNHAFLLASFVSFAQFFTRTGAVFAVIPLMGYQDLTLSSAQVGSALSVSGLVNMLVIYPAGYIGDRWGRKIPIIAGTLLTGLSMAVFALSSSYTTFLMAALLWGLGSGLGGTLPAAYAADVSAGDSYGTTLGIYRTISDVGYVLGPLLLSSGAAAVGFRASLWGCTLLFLIGGGLFAWRAPETLRPKGVDVVAYGRNPH